jgi:hypothetical protein
MPGASARSSVPTGRETLLNRTIVLPPHSRPRLSGTRRQLT